MSVHLNPPECKTPILKHCLGSKHSQFRWVVVLNQYYWLIDWLIDFWLIDWLIDWLSDWLIVMMMMMMRIMMTHCCTAVRQYFQFSRRAILSNAIGFLGVKRNGREKIKPVFNHWYISSLEKDFFYKSELCPAQFRLIQISFFQCRLCNQPFTFDQGTRIIGFAPDRQRHEV